MLFIYFFAIHIFSKSNNCTKRITFKIFVRIVSFIRIFRMLFFWFALIFKSTMQLAINNFNNMQAILKSTTTFLNLKRVWRVYYWSRWHAETCASHRENRCLKIRVSDLRNVVKVIMTRVWINDAARYIFLHRYSDLYQREHLRYLA